MHRRCRRRPGRKPDRMRLCRTAAVVSLIVFLSSFAAAGPLTLTIERAFVGEAAGSGEPVLDLKLAPQSAQEFGDLTARHIGKIVELRIDGRVVFAPIVRDPIRSGSKRQTASGVAPPSWTWHRANNGASACLAAGLAGAM